MLFRVSNLDLLCNQAKGQWRDDVFIWNHFLPDWPIGRRSTGEFPYQRPVARSFEVFFDLRLNKRFSKQSRRRWFQTPSRIMTSLRGRCVRHQIHANAQPFSLSHLNINRSNAWYIISILQRFGYSLLLPDYCLLWLTNYNNYACVNLHAASFNGMVWWHERNLSYL